MSLPGPWLIKLLELVVILILPATMEDLLLSINLQQLDQLEPLRRCDNHTMVLQELRLSTRTTMPVAVVETVI